MATLTKRDRWAQGWPAEPEIRSPLRHPVTVVAGIVAGALVFAAAVVYAWKGRRLEGDLVDFVVRMIYLEAVAFLTVGVVLVSIYFVRNAWVELRASGGFWRGDFIGTCRRAMRYLGYALLLSLQFFIAAEIIATVKIATAEFGESATTTGLLIQLGQLGATILFRAFLGLILRKEVAEDDAAEERERASAR